MTISQDSRHPTGVVDTSPRGSSGAVRARTRKAKAALDMRRKGETWDVIAKALGYPTGRAALIATEKVLEDELSTQEGAEFMRQMASEQLMKVLKPLLRAATNPNDPNWLAAANQVRLLVAQHADLMGYTAPKKQINVNPTAAQIERWAASLLQGGQPAVEEVDIFRLDDIDDDTETIDAEIVDEDDHAVPA